MPELPRKVVWALRENSIKIFDVIAPPYLGIALRILLSSVLLICWGTILLVTFSLSS